MTKANPMYLVLGGSHPHAFLHDRRMVGRDMTKEWGTLQWNSDTATQVPFQEVIYVVRPSI
jgi:hypothetical protein